MTFRKIFLSLLVIFYTLSCKSSGDDSRIRIGVIASLTGQTAAFGTAMTDGIRLATEERNAQGGLLGKPIELLVEDNQSKIDEARTTAIKLIQRDKVAALLGEVASSRSLAAAPEAQRSQIPMLSPASTNPKLTEIGDYIFRACFTDAFQGASLARFAYEDLKWRRVAVLFDVRNEYSVGLKDVFISTFTQLGGQVAPVQSYSEGDTEFRAQLTTMRGRSAIKGSTPDGIFLPGYYTEVGLIARQARTLGITAPFLGGDGWTGYKSVERAGSALDGGYFSDHYAEDDPDPKVQNFIQNFQKRFGHAPNTFAVLGYDAAHMLYDAIVRAQSSEGPKVRAALAQTQNFQGVSGSISIAPDRSVAKTLSILKIDGGKIQLYKKWAPSN